MNSSEICPRVNLACTPKSPFASEDGEMMTQDAMVAPDLASSVNEVEKVLEYKFTTVKLLEEALTHSSRSNSTSYERLEFVGDAALGLAISNNIFLTYPDLDPGQLTLLRAVNVSTEKLARAAVKHGLHRYVRHNAAAALDEKVRDFAMAVEQEDEIEVYGGAIQAPKILSDIVESVAAAVYVDCGFDLKASWPIFERLLKPLVTLDLLQQQPHPVTMLFELCQKNRKQIYIDQSREGNNSIAKVFVDGELVASASSKQKENAKIRAAKDALQELSYNNGYKINTDYFGQLNGLNEIEGAKHILYELCTKKKWSKPIYKTETEIGPAHDRRFMCSVQIETVKTEFVTKGEEKCRIKDAENSAASMMLLGLQESKYL